MGRPKSKDPKGKTLRVRLTKSEWDALNEDVEASGMVLSDRVRQMLKYALGLPSKKVRE